MTPANINLERMENELLSSDQLKSLCVTDSTKTRIQKITSNHALQPIITSSDEARSLLTRALDLKETQTQCTALKNERFMPVLKTVALIAAAILIVGIVAFIALALTTTAWPVVLAGIAVAVAYIIGIACCLLYCSMSAIFMVKSFETIRSIEEKVVRLNNPTLPAPTVLNISRPTLYLCVAAIFITALCGGGIVAPLYDAATRKSRFDRLQPLVTRAQQQLEQDIKTYQETTLPQARVALNIPYPKKKAQWNQRCQEKVRLCGLGEYDALQMRQLPSTVKNTADAIEELDKLQAMYNTLFSTLQLFSPPA